MNNFKSLKKTMSSLMISSCLIGFGMAFSAPQISIAAPIAIEQLSQFESVTNVTISPDGKHVAALFAVQNQKWPVISIWNGEDMSQTPIWIPSATNRIIFIDFFTNDKISFIAEQPITRGDGRITYTYKLYIATIDGKTIIEPFKKTGTKNKEIREQMEKGISVGVFNSNLYSDDEILISTVEPETFAQEIYKYNTKTDNATLVARESESWGFDSAGVDLATGIPLVRQKVDVRANEFYLVTQVKDRQTNEWIEHPELGYKLKERVGLNILGFDEDPSRLLVQTNRGRNTMAVYSYDLKTKAFDKEPLFANEKYDISDVYEKHDKIAKKLVDFQGISFEGPSETQVWFDKKWVDLVQKFKNTFPDTNVKLFPATDLTADAAIVSVDSTSLPTEYYNYNKGKITKIGSKRPWIDTKSLGKSTWITYAARDGLEIPAILTLPPGYDKSHGRIPLVVHPHGGPWARDHMDWDDTGWVQFMATRGVAVLQPQYRGSEGLGSKLWKAGDFEWGQKMQDDKDDGAAYLVKEGIADPKRMAIFGYSYGGFAAIAASVRPNSPYKCAIAGAGVSSLDRIGNLWGSNPLSNDVQGRTVKGMDPIKNVDKANIPIMLYHGDRDRQADTDHSRLFYKAMKAANKDIEYTEIKDMHHTLPWRPEWSKQSLLLIENYFKSDKCGIFSK